MQIPPVTYWPRDPGQVPHHPVSLICPRERILPSSQQQKPQQCQQPACPKHLGTVASARVGLQPLLSGSGVQGFSDLPLSTFSALPLHTLEACSVCVCVSKSSRLQRMEGSFLCLICRVFCLMAPCLPVFTWQTHSYRSDAMETSLTAAPPPDLCPMTPPVSTMTSCTVEFSTVCKLFHTPSDH